MQNDVRSGYVWGLGGFALLSVGDAVIKTMAGVWPGTAVAALRFAIGAAVLCGLLAWRKGRAGFRPRRPWLQAARGFALAMASLLFFLGIFVMPLAEATAIQFANPMLTALISTALLGERAGRIVWAATILAFVGVLIVLRPNVAELGAAALLPLCAAFFMGLLLTLNRMTMHDTSVLGAQFFVSAGAAATLVVAAVIGHVSGVQAFHVAPPPPSVVARCALVALTATTAHSLIYRATRRASSAAIAPTVYVQIIVATVVGIVWFSDWPDRTAMLGTAIIIASGLWLWYRGQTGSDVKHGVVHDDVRTA